jgi:hypothetical protein
VAGPRVFIITSSIPPAFKSAVITPIRTEPINTTDSILIWIFDLMDFMSSLSSRLTLSGKDRRARQVSSGKARRHSPGILA